MTDNLGCLRRYVKVAQLLHPQVQQQLVGHANGIKGFLCNFQIPLMWVVASQMRGHMVEVGCWYGRTTSVLLLGAEPDLRLTCVDTFKGSEEHQDELQGHCFRPNFEANLSQFAGRYTIREGMSHEVAATFEDESLDCVWIDAGHGYEDVKRDIKSWTPKLKRGGLLIGHDYPEPSDPNGGFEELTRAVNRWVRDSTWDYADFGWCAGIWGARRV